MPTFKRIWIAVTAIIYNFFNDYRRLYLEIKSKRPVRVKEPASKSLKIWIVVTGVILLIVGLLLVVLDFRLNASHKNSAILKHPVMIVGGIYILLSIGIMLRNNLVRIVTLVFTGLVTAVLAFEGLRIYLTDYTGFGGLIIVIFFVIPMCVVNTFFFVFLKSRDVAKMFS
jgi:hypothetical protein